MCNFVLMFRMCLSCNAKKIQKLKDKRLEKMQVFKLSQIMPLLRVNKLSWLAVQLPPDDDIYRSLLLVHVTINVISKQASKLQEHKTKYTILE